MDLLKTVKANKERRFTVLSWLLTSELRLTWGAASGQRLMLAGLQNFGTVGNDRLRFMVTTAEEALAAVERIRPGVLFLTNFLESGHGLDVVPRARTLVDDLRIILMVNALQDDLTDAGHSMADAVYTEQEVLTPAQPLFASLMALAVGKRYRSPMILEAMAAAGAEGRSGPWRERLPPLSPRERQWVDFVVEGLNDREIAERMELSYETVRGYGKTIRRKLGVASRAQVMLTVMKMTLLSR
jgi:DNA-binding NarL/FixJ family response regulator